MKKNIILIVILIICIFLSFSSCRIEDSYKEFFVKGFDAEIDDKCFTSEKYDFARIEDVIIEPSIKEINHGEYRIFVSAYSQTGEETVKIKKITVKESDVEVYSSDLLEIVNFDKKFNEVYEGTFVAGLFTDDMIEIYHNKEFSLIVEAELFVGDDYYSKQKTFEVSVVVHKSPVFPTWNRPFFYIKLHGWSII